MAPSGEMEGAFYLNFSYAVGRACVQYATENPS
jgi:hypothetical protein